MATQKQINTIISEISSAEEPGSVTNVMVGTVLDHLNTGAVNRESEIAGVTEKVDAAKDAADKAQTTADKAQTQANKAYNEAIAAHEAAVAAFPIARGVALENNVNTLNDNLDSLAGRHNALADTVKAMGASSSGIHKVIEEDVDSISEPGIYEVEDEDSVNRYFIFHTKYKRSRPGSQSPLKTIQYKLCDGQISVRQKTTEAYGDWEPIGEGISELDTRVTTLESNLNAFKVVNKAFIEKMEDSGEIEEGVFYEEGSGILYFFTYSVAEPCETKISHAGISYRTYKNGAWGNWVNKAEELAEAAKGAIYTEDSIDSLRKPQVYTLKDGSLLVVTRTIGDRITTYRQFHFADNGDILFRGCSNNAINWTAWQPLASVQQLRSEANGMHNDGLGFSFSGLAYVYSTGAGTYAAQSFGNYLSSGNIPGPFTGILVGQGIHRLVINPRFHNSILMPWSSGPELLDNALFVDEALLDWNGMRHFCKYLSIADRSYRSIYTIMYLMENEKTGLPKVNGIWYLPSLGQLIFIWNNLDKINRMLLNNGDEPISGSYWSSTEFADGAAYALDMDTGNVILDNKSARYKILEVTEFMDDGAFVDFQSKLIDKIRNS